MGLTVGEIQVTVRVEITDVAKRGPSLCIVSPFSFLWIVMIGKLRTVGEVHSADLTHQNFSVVLVQNFDLADHRAANATAMRQPFLGGADCHAISLRTGVVFD